VTAAIAPGLLPGLSGAPPATNAPPAPLNGGGAGQPVPGQTFADAVAAISDAAQATGGGPNAPPGNAPASSTNPAHPADLLLLIAGVLARLKGGVTGAGDGEMNDTPLPDRPAGAGVEQMDTGAMEALMAQLLLVRTNVEEPSGSGVATTVAEALASGIVSGTAGDAGVLLDGIEQQPQGAAPGVTAGVASAAAAAGTSTDASSALPAPAAAADDAKTPAQPNAAEPLAATATRSASASTVVAASAEAATKVDVSAAGSAGRAAGVPTPAAAGVSAAATDRPAEPSAGVRDRAPQGSAEATAAIAAGAPAQPAAQGGVTRLAVATRPETAGPLTVQIANTVQSAVLRGEHEVRLVLNPPELGRVEIRIVQGADGISVHMRAEQAGARDLIQQQLPVLHQALEARDLRVDRLQVSHAEQGGAAHQSFDSRGFANQQRQERDDAPEWSPLASFGMTAPQPKRDAAHPRVTPDGSLDVMA